MKKLDWLGHIVEAVAMAGIVAALLLPVHDWRIAATIGLAFAIGHFHGREKRDYEVSVAMRPPHLKGYLIWRWSWDQVTDFVPVLIVCAAAAYAVQSLI